MSNNKSQEQAQQEKVLLKQPELYVMFTDSSSEFLKSYELEPNPFIGQGSFGTVFKCKKKSTGQTYAVKIMKITTPQQFQNISKEAQQSKKLIHESIIQCYEIFPQNLFNKNTVFCNEIAMILEYAEFKSLTDYLKCESIQDGCLSKEDFKRITNQLLLGISHCHQNQIIICDLKPENILVTKDPKQPDKKIFKLSDFGGMVLLDSNQLQQSSYYLHSQQLNGLQYTELFASPELMISKKVRDTQQNASAIISKDSFRMHKKTDEYSAFCVLLVAAGATNDQLKKIHSLLKSAVEFYNDPMFINHQRTFSDFIPQLVDQLQIAKKYGQCFADIIQGMGLFDEKQRKTAQDLHQKYYKQLSQDEKKIEEFEQMSEVEQSQFMVSLRSTQFAVQAYIQDIQLPESYKEVKNLNFKLPNGNYFYSKDEQNKLYELGQEFVEGFEVQLDDNQQQFKILYKGQLQNGVREGKGLLYNSKNQIIYEGDFQNGEIHGNGKEFLWIQGQQKIIFDGNFIKGKKNGEGEQFYETGATYKGNFEDDKPNGYGEFCPSKVGVEITINNETRRVLQNAELKYCGQFINGLFDGEGEFRDIETDTLVFKGFFEKNMKKGQGTTYNGDAPQTDNYVNGLRQDDYEINKEQYDRILSMNLKELQELIRKKIEDQDSDYNVS